MEGKGELGEMKGADRHRFDYWGIGSLGGERDKLK
jgi:hypothetical protein